MITAELQRKAAMISMEAETNGFIQIVSSLSELLQNFLGSMKDTMLDSMSSIRQDQAFGFKPNTTLERRLQKTNFTSLTSIMVPVPSGMATDWPSFIEAIRVSEHATLPIVADTLEPAIRYFATLLASPETLMNITPTNELSKIVLHPKEIDKAKKAVGECYSKHSVAASRAYGDVFTRNADWKSVNTDLASISDHLAKVNPSLIADKVDELVSILERLAIRMRQDPGVYKVSGVTSANIANVSLQIGFEVEFYASHCFLVQTAVAAIKDTEKHLLELLDD